MLKILIVPTALLLSATCLADLKQATPEEACAFLSDLGLKGRAWTEYGDGASGCASNYKDIGSGSPLPNNLAFYATGSGHIVDQVKLVVNFNQPNSKAAATNSLLAASARLSQKSLGASLPQSITKAIQAGTPAVADVGTGSVEVIRDEWPTGKGYEIHVVMK